jgi:hypothetical protein
MISIMAVSIVEISISSYILPITLIITIGIMLSCIALILIIVTRPEKSKSLQILYQKLIPDERLTVEICPTCGVRLPENSKRGTVCGFCGKFIK